MPSSSSDSSRDVLLERLAEEFVERHRRGEQPPLSEYTDRHPDLAADIRDLFPALVKIEHLKPLAGDLTGDFTPASGPTDSPPPERLGEYRILRQVGSGGMGIVYEAEQESLGRHVALKVLPRQALLRATYLERFRREAKAAARLHHTNIVPVFGVGECDGTHYYAMQFIRGEGLDRVLGDLRRLRAAPGGATTPALPSEGSVAHSLLTGRFAAPAAPPAEESSILNVPSPATAAEGARSSSSLSVGGPEGQYYRGIARVGLQVADALAYAHQQGILHRDIKPSNLLLDQKGTVWITDFGLAKTEGADDLTHTGHIVGTIRFMAPERFDGRSLPQSDVYSLGLTLYELLTLRPAFDDTNKGRLIEKVLHELPVSLRKLDRRVPRDLETIVLKCLAKEPAERYATAEALAEDLRRFLTDRPVKARRASAAERLWRWARRNPLVASLVGCVAGLLVVVAVVSTVAALRMDAALAQTRQAERKARLREAEALIGQAHGIRFSRRAGQRFEALAALDRAAVIGRELDQPAEWFDRLRNESIAALALPDVEVVRQWEGWPQGTVSLCIDGALERYARSDAHGNVSVRRVADDVEVAALHGPGRAVDVNLSLDGRLLTVHDQSTMRLEVWRLAELVPVLIHEVADVTRWGANFSPDGQRLLAIHRNSGISVLTLADGQVVRWPARGSAAAGPCFRPDGSQVMFHTRLNGQETVLVADARTGAVVATLPHPDGFSWFDWHPTGRMIATCDNHRIRFWDTTTWQEAPLLHAPVGGGGRCCFTPDGAYLLVNDWAGPLRIWDMHSGRKVFTTPMSYAMHDMGRDGRLLILAGPGNPVKLIRVATGREFRTLSRRRGGYSAPAPIGCVALRPDGRLLATMTAKGTCALVELATGAELAVIPDSGSVQSVAFDTSGALLVHGTKGLHRWPVQYDPASHRCRVGPAKTLYELPSNGQHGSSSDGHVLALPSFDRGALLLRSDQRGGPLTLGPQEDVRRCAVSPDGRWVATATFGDTQGSGVKVWDAATGRPVKDPPINGGTNVGFSPDGKWLVTTYPSCRLWKVGTWDSRVLAVGGEAGLIRLVDPATGREYTRLEAPEQTRFWPCCFTPDGTQLIALGRDSQALHVWDLRLVRRQLADRGLDWDAPPQGLRPAAP